MLFLPSGRSSYNVIGEVATSAARQESHGPATEEGFLTTKPVNCLTMASCCLSWCGRHASSSHGEGADSPSQTIALVYSSQAIVRSTEGVAAARYLWKGYIILLRAKGVYFILGNQDWMMDPEWIDLDGESQTWSEQQDSASLEGLQRYRQWISCETKAYCKSGTLVSLKPTLAFKIHSCNVTISDATSLQRLRCIEVTKVHSVSMLPRVVNFHSSPLSVDSAPAFCY